MLPRYAPALLTSLNSDWTGSRPGGRCPFPTTTTYHLRVRTRWDPARLFAPAFCMLHGYLRTVEHATLFSSTDILADAADMRITDEHHHLPTHPGRLVLGVGRVVWALLRPDPAAVIPVADAFWCRSNGGSSVSGRTRSWLPRQVEQWRNATVSCRANKIRGAWSGVACRCVWRATTTPFW